MFCILQENLHIVNFTITYTLCKSGFTATAETFSHNIVFNFQSRRLLLSGQTTKRMSLQIISLCEQPLVYMLQKAKDLSFTFFIL